MKKGSPLGVCLAVLLMVFGFGGQVWAYHNGGVAYCEGCHTMHNSFEGQPMTTSGSSFQTVNQAPSYLLKGSDPGSTCLNCHQKEGETGPDRYHISTAESDMPPGSPPLQLTPGGDFGWLKKTFTWPGGTSKGERHGHNIVAVDYGYSADTTFTVAPSSGGAEYPADKLTCVSCHDPHGEYRIISSGVQATSGKPIRESGSYGALPDTNTAVGVYRLLGGAGYYPKSVGSQYAFAFGAPFAVAPTDYNRAETTGSDQVRVSYGKNMDLFCANCHLDMHSTFGGYEHPVGQALASAIAANYNMYVKTGDLTGSQSTSFLSLVSFQIDNTSDSTALLNRLYDTNGNISTQGPTTSDRITCLTCHRAHASGYRSMLRFPVNQTFMTVDGGGVPVYPDPSIDPDDAHGRTQAEQQQALYGRPATVWAIDQRDLCNKCHIKD